MAVKLPHRHRNLANVEARPPADLGVARAYLVDEPLWYLRLTSRFRLSWRRELATVAAVFGLGVGFGLLLGHF
jgi:hypothetical protein